jgi:hypothetical protein
MSSERRLDLEPLRSALSQFDVALSDLRDEPDRRANRDSVALHYMIVWNFLVQAITRYIELQSIKTFEAFDASFQKLIRRADALGLVKTGWPEFGRFRDARNVIAHMYDEPRAKIIVDAAPAFSAEAHFVLDTLARREADGKG